MGKNSYKEFKLKNKEEGGKGYSKTALNSYAANLINDPEYVSETYSKSGDEMVKKESTPSKNFRNSLKKVVQKNFGVDAADASKLDTVELPKEVGEAVIDVATTAIKDYLDSGKKFNFPQTAPDEAKMGIQIVEVGTKTSETTKVVKDEKTGNYSVVPTGKKVTTKEHKALKVSNKIPFWLKESKDI